MDLPLAPQTTRIRNACTADVPALGRVRAESWREAYDGILPEAELWRQRAYRSELRLARAIGQQRRGRRILVATDLDDEPVGYAWGGPQLDRRYPYRGEIYELYLHPRAQGQGTGRVLLGATIWELVSLSLNPVMVWVLAANRARHFYAACGAEQIARGSIAVGGAKTTRLAFGWRHSLPLPPNV